MGRKKDRIKGRRGVGNPEALQEAYEKLRLMYSRAREDWEKLLIRRVLRDWGEISEAIDTALLNHKYKVITIPLTKRDYSIFLRFEYDKQRGRWVLANADIGKRVGWGYKWEFMLDRMQLIRRDRETREVIAY